ncbi:MAG: lipopolysaccharide biosynthesis protein [Promethearchaeota archaeon]
MKIKFHGSKKKSKFIAGVFIGTCAIIIGSFLAQCNWNGFNSNGSGQISTDQVGTVNILFLSNDDDTKVEKALFLDNNFNVTKNAPFNESVLDSDYDAVVMLNYNMNATTAGNLTSYFTNGGNIFMIMGPGSSTAGSFFQNLGMDVNVSENHDNSGIDYTVENRSHVLVRNIQWSSAPSIWNRSVVEGINDSFGVFLRSDQDPFDPIFFSYSNGTSGTIIVFTPWIVPSADNLQIELWPYFNYMIYLTTSYVAGTDPTTLPTFAAWPHSPVPHLQDTITITIVVSALGILAFSLFIVQKKRSKRTAIVLSEKALEEMTRQREKEERRRREVMEREGKAGKEMEHAPDHVDLTDNWEQVGTHKQISGFLFGLFAGILLGIPQIVLTGIVFPRWIMPYPQVAGWFDWVKQFFQAIWMIFDVGTSIALAKYFAQYRIKQPKKAVHYIQIFVWWQVLSGVVQIIMISLIGSIVFPQTNFAHLSWLVVLHSLIQYPGFFVVFMYIFQGMQRTDLQNLANLLYQAVLMLGFQYIFILIFRLAFANNPQGGAFWAGIGYAVGQYVAEWGIFFIMMKFYKNLGFSVSTIFRVDFTREELKEALFFGGKEAIGHMWVPLAYMFQVWMLGAFLPNYNEQMGLYGYANMLMQITALVGFLTEGFLAPVSEAHSHQKHALLEVTIAQGLKWSNFIIFYLIALLAAVAGPFILILAGDAWAGAVRFIPLLLVYSIVQPHAWLGDKTLAGTGYTGRAAVIWIVEQGGKMFLLVVFILGFNIRVVEVILYAHIPALWLKVSLCWFTIRRKVAKPKVYLWNSWIAPGIAATIMFVVMYALTFVFTGWLILAEFMLAIFLFLFVYSFLCGLLGCYDDNTLAEYKKAASMVGKPLRIFAMGMYSFAEWGCKASPKLHNRFPLDRFEDAMSEARDLEKEKLKLEI